MPDDGRTNLGAVSMDDDDSEPVVHESRNLGCSGSHVFILLLEGPILVASKNRVPAKGKNRDGSLTLQARFFSLKLGGECWVPFVPNVPSPRQDWVIYKPCMSQLV